MIKKAVNTNCIYRFLSNKNKRKDKECNRFRSKRSKYYGKESSAKDNRRVKYISILIRKGM